MTIYDTAGDYLEARLRQNWQVVELSCRSISIYNQSLREQLESIVGEMVNKVDLSDAMDNGEWDFVNGVLIIKDKNKALLFKLAVEVS